MKHHKNNLVVKQANAINARLQVTILDNPTSGHTFLGPASSMFPIQNPVFVFEFFGQ